MTHLDALAVVYARLDVLVDMIDAAVVDVENSAVPSPAQEHAKVACQAARSTLADAGDDVAAAAGREHWLTCPTCGEQFKI